MRSSALKGGRAPYGARGLKSHSCSECSRAPQSRPVWGAWIEIHGLTGDGVDLAGSRAPYGARGLKCRLRSRPHTGRMSRPVWGAWIEISRRAGRSRHRACRAPYGARGLKSRRLVKSLGACCRAPYGARGLKFFNLGGIHLDRGSRPVWGAWIEITTAAKITASRKGRAPYGARGLKS